MSNSQITEQQDVTPPPTFREPPLTPPLTNKKPAAEAQPRVIALFQKLQAGRYTEGKNWIEFWLAKGEFDQIQSTLQRDDALLKYAEASIRYDYDETTLLLAVRMPTGVHEFFIAEVEKDIGSQIEGNRDGPSRRAQFARNIRPARSTEIRFTDSKSRFHPDISFGHRDARFPGVIIEVAFSQDYKRLRRLAENYLLDSLGNIRVVVGINIVYGKGSRGATLSIWRSKVSTSSTVYDVDVEEEMKDEIFRDDEGNPVEHPGLRLHLSDFTSKKIVQEQMGDDDDAVIYISGTQLYQYVATAEDNVQRATREDPLPVGIRINKRRRSTTPPEEIRSEDEADYVKQEKKVAKRGDDDSDYEYK